jgi:hypothetical protein
LSSYKREAVFDVMACLAMPADAFHCPMNDLLAVVIIDYILIFQDYGIKQQEKY